MVTLPAWLIVAFIISSCSMNSIVIVIKMKERVKKSTRQNRYTLLSYLVDNFLWSSQFHFFSIMSMFHNINNCITFLLKEKRNKRSSNMSVISENGEYSYNDALQHVLYFR